MATAGSYLMLHCFQWGKFQLAGELDSCLKAYPVL
jgi:hypothetical protein